RTVPAILRFGHRSYRTPIQGIRNGGELYRLLDSSFQQVELPPRGVILTDYLAKILDISPGETLVVETLEGERPVREVPEKSMAVEGLNAGDEIVLSAIELERP
ncbi:MAG: ABC transporter permease, partial [Chitinivibrionia bacterium]|nr:ABC transporter permease [Chitinivibrionia bacterium]